jgi:hypothetical protein
MNYGNANYGQRNEVDADLIRDLADFIRHCKYEDLKSEVQHLSDELRSSEISAETAEMALTICWEEFARRQGSEAA